MRKSSMGACACLLSIALPIITMTVFAAEGKKQHSKTISGPKQNTTTDTTNRVTGSTEDSEAANKKIRGYQNYRDYISKSSRDALEGALDGKAISDLQSILSELPYTTLPVPFDAAPKFAGMMDHLNAFFESNPEQKKYKKELLLSLKQSFEIGYGEHYLKWAKALPGSIPGQIETRLSLLEEEK